MNDVSSRSHTIFTLTLTHKLPDGQTVQGKLNMVAPPALFATPFTLRSTSSHDFVVESPCFPQYKRCQKWMVLYRPCAPWNQCPKLQHAHQPSSHLV